MRTQKSLIPQNNKSTPITPCGPGAVVPCGFCGEKRHQKGGGVNPQPPHQMGGGEIPQHGSEIYQQNLQKHTLTCAGSRAAASPECVLIFLFSNKTILQISVQDSLLIHLIDLQTPKILEFFRSHKSKQKENKKRLNQSESISESVLNCSVQSTV